VATEQNLLHPEGIFSKRVRYDYLFEMEMWLKGLESYFDIDRLPVPTEEAHTLPIRNYVEDVGIVHEVLGHVGQVASKFLGEGREDFATFILYLEREIAGTMPTPGRRSSRLASAESELAQAIEKIEDLVRIVEELSRASYIGMPTYMSLGRTIIGFLQNDRNLGAFFREDLFPVFDVSDRRQLQKALQAVGDRQARRELATLYVGLFKGLRYVDAAQKLLPKAALRRRTIVLFTLTRSLMDRVLEYVRQRLKADRTASERVDALDRLIAATEMELRKVMEGELVDVVRLRDPRSVQERLENAAGTLRDLFEQNILALAEAYGTGIDARRFFPQHVTKRQQSLEVRRDLWKLVRSCELFQESEEKQALSDFLGDLATFRHGTMRYLMFRDWKNFDRFAQEFKKERSLRTHQLGAHRFEMFLRTLVREVSKRQVLEDEPFRPPV
jgi:hypothetical protein